MTARKIVARWNQFVKPEYRIKRDSKESRALVSEVREVLQYEIPSRYTIRNAPILL